MGLSGLTALRTGHTMLASFRSNAFQVGLNSVVLCCFIFFSFKLPSGGLKRSVLKRKVRLGLIHFSSICQVHFIKTSHRLLCYNHDSSIKSVITIIMSEIAASSWSCELPLSIYILNWINWKWLDLRPWRGDSPGGEPHSLTRVIWRCQYNHSFPSFLSVRPERTLLRGHWWPVTHLQREAWLAAGFPR